MNHLREYVADLADRAVKTAAQSAVLVLGADQINALDADWRLVGGMAAGGAILSVLTNLAERGIRGRSE